MATLSGAGEQTDTAIEVRDVAEGGVVRQHGRASADMRRHLAAQAHAGFTQRRHACFVRFDVSRLRSTWFTPLFCPPCLQPRLVI